MARYGYHNMQPDVVPDRQIHEEVDEIELGWAEQEAEKKKLENKLAKLAPAPENRKKGTHKVFAKFRVEPELLDWFRGTGSGWQSRMRLALHQYRDRIEK